MTWRVLLVAEPWWVNLLMLVPFCGAWWWRRTRVSVAWTRLTLLAIWAAAFGIVEAAVVVYLRAIVSLGLGSEPTFAAIGRLSASAIGAPMVTLPPDLLRLEIWREAATLVMLLAVAGLMSGKGWNERIASFLWSFAVWDLAYYLGLRLVVGWPARLSTPDVLFLIPEPWLSPVWFPILVSGLTMLAVLLSARSPSGPSRSP